ncbi:glutamine synthetase family protein [Gordonia paraffinivorans]|uniref:glutamine synthetase family protein n=1 Tax=Gordonia paraffinivorans TaxID=175628 RepID=UPI001446ED05|nr:glutamine synthetase family protein [Gordonia paraffinivorans]
MSRLRPMTQIEVPDYDLGLRGKLVRSDKTNSGMAFCTIAYGLSLVDDTSDTPFSNAENGYPDGVVVADEATRVELPWRQGTDAVIADFVDADGRPFGPSARGVLLGLIDEYRSLDLEPVLGYEYEVWIFRETPGAEFHGTSGLTPLGRTHNAYSLTRSVEADELASEYIDRMTHVGIEVEAFHSELGPGFFEFALAPAPAKEAADGAARARQYLRDLCAEHGLRASFMAKPFGGFSGAGGHVHSSLVRDGANVMVDEPGRFSDVGSRYLAGLLQTMTDFTVLFSPYVNSFKRADPAMFVGDRAFWGSDDRNATCRALLGSTKAARIEHRRPGADANPYVVAAALLAGGLVGLQDQLPLPEAGPVGAKALPDNLGDAITALENSGYAAQTLGKAFVEAFASTRRAEHQRYEAWMRTFITPWELQRHLEHQ